MLTEHDHQVALFYWSRLMEGQIPELALLYAVPNAGRRTKRQGAWMVAEGLKAGVPDLVLPVARHGYHGLYIELKTERGRLTPEQKAWLKALYDQGYLAVMCRGWEDARDLILCYLESTPIGDLGLDR